MTGKTLTGICDHKCISHTPVYIIHARIALFGIKTTMHHTALAIMYTFSVIYLHLAFRVRGLPVCHQDNAWCQCQPTHPHNTTCSIIHWEYIKNILRFLSRVPRIFILCWAFSRVNCASLILAACLLFLASYGMGPVTCHRKLGTEE